MKTFKLIILATLVAASPACKKKDKPSPEPATMGSNTGSSAAGSNAMGSDHSGHDMGSGSAMAGSGSADTGSGSAMAGSGSGSATAEDTTADWIKLYASHAPAKPKDPVELHFEKFKITKAKFDPKKPEGGTATLELDFTALKSDSAMRDKDIAAPELLDTSKYTTATIDIANVKTKAGQTYTADATVKFHGVTKKYPITFDVVDTTDTSIRIKLEHKLSRADFKVGKDADEGLAREVTLRAQLTVPKG
jgi:polyisoprenoid-binding protein YceI